MALFGDLVGVESRHGLKGFKSALLASCSGHCDLLSGAGQLQHEIERYNSAGRDCYALHVVWKAFEVSKDRVVSCRELSKLVSSFFVCLDRASQLNDSYYHIVQRRASAFESYHTFKSPRRCLAEDDCGHTAQDQYTYQDTC